MKITKVRDPGIVVQGYDNKERTLEGIFFRLTMSHREFNPLSDKLKNSLKNNSRWTYVFENDESNGVISFYFVNKARWALLTDLQGDGKLSVAAFLGYLSITKKTKVRYKGEAAFVLISLLFSMCIDRSIWKFDSSADYLIKKDDKGWTEIVVPASQYAPLKGNYTSRYQYAIDRLRKIGLEVKILFP